MRLLNFLKGSWGWVALSVLLGSLTIGASVALMGTSAWLISEAALHPSIAVISVAIVGVQILRHRPRRLPLSRTSRFAQRHVPIAESLACLVL